ncbi:MAG: response regulator [Acidobacteria bacterium]|nr:response regulator [Acidobacteriota bacterium]
MSKKILLADDSITIQKVVELTFSDGDYEVIATNNGTKAIEAIPKVKPDIILSDIIMPEKNGYEVCEWVKSHPEHRNIPVILLTGTFEPFDPDRAEKAGCDAVVTKPFESQSLITKVEELIARRTSAPEASPGGSAAEEPFVDDDASDNSEESGLGEPMMTEGTSEDTPPPPAPPSFEMGGQSFEDSGPFEGAESRDREPERESSPFPPEEEEPKPHGDVFGEMTPPAEESGDEDSATRMLPKMTMEDIKKLQQEQKEELAEPRESATQPSLSSEPEDSPFEQSMEDSAQQDAPSETLPGMTMDEIRRRDEEAADRRTAPEAAPFGDTPLSEEQSGEEAAPLSSEPPERSWDEDVPASTPADSEDDFDDTATRMIPKLEFGDIQRMQQEREREEEAASPEPPEMVEASHLGMGAPGPAEDAGAANPFASEAESEESREREPEEEPSVPFTEPEPELLPPPPHPPAEPVSHEPEPEATAGSAYAEAPAGASLSDEQVERIARRVVELLSDKAIREIAWEVIPEAAEMIVRERIRELEREEA